MHSTKDRSGNSARFELTDSDAVSANRLWIGSTLTARAELPAYARKLNGIFMFEFRIEIYMIFDRIFFFATVSTRYAYHNLSVMLASITKRSSYSMQFRISSRTA